MSFFRLVLGEIDGFHWNSLVRYYPCTGEFYLFCQKDTHVPEFLDFSSLLYGRAVVVHEMFRLLLANPLMNARKAREVRQTGTLS